MNIISILFQLIGALGFLLYGMKMMSDGIQKSAGKSLHRILGMMTGNRFSAMLTGMFITMIIQSSGATTVMVVSFVNAGLLTLTQSVGVIFGANIGTTVTAWIVAFFGFNFKISAVAIPVFGIGYILTVIKKLQKQNIGEALMGFGLLFLGLDLLSKTIPTLDANNIQFLTAFTDKGTLSVLIGIAAGMIITVLLHSSSASTAIILTMSYNRLLPWEFAAAMVLGSNIGSTIDAVIAAFGTKVNARRAALVHVLFNVTGTVIAALLLHPLLALVDRLVPGPVEANITFHIAMLHTVFNVLNTLLFLPFTTQIASLTEVLIKPKKDETPDVYRLDFMETGAKENAAAYVIRAEKEIADMTGVVTKMFDRIEFGFAHRTSEFIETQMESLAKEEDYADQMQEQLSKFLVHCSQLPVSDKLRNNVSIMLRIVDDLESMTDDCYSVALLLRRSIEKDMTFAEEDIERLHPYIDLAHRFLSFIRENINKHLSEEQLTIAQDLEDQIDVFRKNLKKVARKRLESGADVKSELLYIDLVRNIEKIGDRAFSISEALAQTQ
ncbi:Na/Pi cotransporter family protein [Treponema brennaborense]|uniref:Na/Pi cotransporter family protein n=1 Tax=Treponema brennaborense TaxID=81028 RepID=UPI00059FE352|nr:Na/Pi cotransporter family protein [Treponema brennaborense]